MPPTRRTGSRRTRALLTSRRGRSGQRDSRAQHPLSRPPPPHPPRLRPSLCRCRGEAEPADAKAELRPEGDRGGSMDGSAALDLTVAGLIIAVTAVVWF